MEIASRSLADTVPTLRRIARIDGRSKAAKRVKELAAGYIARLGGGRADAATLVAVQKAAELAALAEELRGKALRGEAVDLDGLLRLEGACARAVRSLRLPTADPTRDSPSLTDYLAQRYPPAAEAADAFESSAAHKAPRTRGRRTGDPSALDGEASDHPTDGDDE
jgi:hypothetical protein